MAYSRTLPPAPDWFKIGARLHPLCMKVPVEPEWAASGPYYRGRMLRHIVGEQRQGVMRMKNGGEFENWDGHRLVEGWKESIRLKMYVIDNAYDIEIVGIAPLSTVIMGCGVANQCYIGELNYYLMLMFRARQGGNDLVYIHRDAIFCVEWAKQFVEGAPGLSERMGMWELQSICAEAAA